MENVEHHVREEEDEMFPQVHELCDEATLKKLANSWSPPRENTNAVLADFL